MYSVHNYRTKKALKEAVAQGPVPAFQPGGMFPLDDGRQSCEGPHYPEPHRWYATVMVEDGQIVKVIV